MILIFSEEADTSTSDVVNWFRYLKIEFKLINNLYPANINWVKDGLVIEQDSETLLLSDVKAVFYRRGNMKFSPDKINFVPLNVLVQKEFDNLSEIFNYEILSKKSINSFNNSTVNKYIVSDKAKKIKILVPKDYIITSVNELQRIMVDTPKLITKTLSGSSIIDIDDTKFGVVYTKLITKKIIKKNKIFQPTYFQEYIEKRYELRIFYLAGQFWTMAIFSQNDKKTTVDFRNYNFEKPNRTVPYTLPKDIEEKLQILMEELKLNCGSIDMIVSKNLQYYFLEVNPIGQFGMVSNPCNYHLEKEIVNYLKYGEERIFKNY
ncbi:grasp-with-spasm system ATP-grasp peptide maturase [Chryseobacterium wangxinyae]|uniref:grasp-with-spasm system ATP-grasp peptide maturase n=1 Tax=Chryseobacterium sp. CY350 TaxID=2997336 RepID=UPI002271A985|nr:grasp-with-spasm system ATP-grasp peptide maturase [Chryseobacterium sp. CY350]MCY0977978.1 grasp-with-spasm system ATP-grasp peptide maturase [Chryseobacterium sp. CY350]WBZ95065.1 grasp-with-spasm system ATP-grasp peptide maturase [Chryseobacterium sp. CY350]